MFQYFIYKSVLAIALMVLPVYDNNNRLFGGTDSKTLIVKKSPDFEITGDGSAENWAKSEWIELPQRKSSGESLTTKVKILYSGTGMYFLFNCQDKS